MADALDSKSSEVTLVWVRVPPPVLLFCSYHLRSYRFRSYARQRVDLLIRSNKPSGRAQASGLSSDIGKMPVPLKAQTSKSVSGESSYEISTFWRF